MAGTTELPEELERFALDVVDELLSDGIEFLYVNIHSDAPYYTKAQLSEIHDRANEIIRSLRSDFQKLYGREL